MPFTHPAEMRALAIALVRDGQRPVDGAARCLLGIAWRRNGPWRIAVSRREAVAALDEHVGPEC